MDNSKGVHHKIKEYLKEAIQGGQLNEGDLLPSEHELAAMFNVNRNWARRALRELEVEGYVLRSQGRRSMVTPVSSRRQALSVGETPTLAVALPEYQDLFDRTIVDGFMGYASDHDVHSLIYNIRLDESEEDAFLHKAPEIGISGLAIWIQHDTPRIAEAIASLRRRRFPIVQIDRKIRGCETDVVVTDNEKIGYALTKALIDKGHELIAFASVFEDASSVRDRFQGYRRALEEGGIPFEEKYHRPMVPHEPKTIREAVSEIMSYRKTPTAFVCIHDRLASLVAEELIRLDYQIPDHLEIAAVDDVHHAQRLGIPMVCVRQDGLEMGRMAAECLLNRLYDPDLPPTTHLLPVLPAAAESTADPYDEPKAERSL